MSLGNFAVPTPPAPVKRQRMLPKAASCTSSGSRAWPNQPSQPPLEKQLTVSMDCDDPLLTTPNHTGPPPTTAPPGYFSSTSASPAGGIGGTGSTAAPANVPPPAQWPAQAHSMAQTAHGEASVRKRKRKRTKRKSRKQRAPKTFCMRQTLRNFRAFCNQTSLHGWQYIASPDSHNPSTAKQVTDRCNEMLNST